ncbi:MAG TPA: phosphatase PAP2 family protein [Thermoguttaceae bacterium]|nr:phosphatase PAP2 family protein [Thermoguttaceae bacterium]
MSRPDRMAAVVFVVVLALPCGACRGKWQFARSGSTPTAQPISGVPAEVVPATTPDAGREFYYCHWDAPGVIPVGYTEPAPAFPSYAESVFDPSPLAADESPYVPLAVDESPYMPPVVDESPYMPRRRGGQLGAGFGRWFRDVPSDYRNYYGWNSMRDLLLGVAGASLLANTSWDEDFNHWYQRDVRSTDTDDFTQAWKVFGEGQIIIPAFAALGMLGAISEDRPLLGRAGAYSGRVTRGYMVGVPPMLFTQFLLGGSRPGETAVGSRWKPFDDDNAVSGHAFIGAVPFITAARMVENPWAKGALYMCSGFTAWSRVNDDRHYLSQALLGWWMAYLACRAVDETARQNENLIFTPLAGPGITGIGVVIRR